MRIKALYVALFSVLLTVPAFAVEPETIVTHETDRHFYKDGQLLDLQDQFEMTYLLDLEKDTLTRTRVYDFLNKKITPDETVYHMEKQLLSHPTNADRYTLKPVVRGVGQAGPDTLEMILVGEKFVETVSSGSDGLILSRARRMS